MNFKYYFRDRDSTRFSKIDLSNKTIQAQPKITGSYKLYNTVIVKVVII